MLILVYLENKQSTKNVYCIEPSGCEQASPIYVGYLMQFLFHSDRKQQYTMMNKDDLQYFMVSYRFN